MRIGGTTAGALAEARSEAGLTVDQVSDRTRITATIIRAIERDDYAVCHTAAGGVAAAAATNGHDGSAGTAWHSGWYAAADLNGQPGTRLLLDMGTSVSVSSVQVLLGQVPGGTVQLRAGNSPSLVDVPVVAQATNPGGTLTLRAAAPVTTRYVLIWFTQLPPDSAGSYGRMSATSACPAPHSGQPAATAHGR